MRESRYSRVVLEMNVSGLLAGVLDRETRGNQGDECEIYMIVSAIKTWTAGTAIAEVMMLPSSTPP